ncbi:MAG TPA: AAA family ATPase [Solirubrobacteraceae bacterium]|nr:AAA family ATPase [Solirubrobacteraceae bacterium]
MLAELERHPHARAVLGPALDGAGLPSHAYLFHGPGGAGKRAAARALAAQLLAEGSGDPAGARARVMSGAHPDLTWVVPSGAHEILVSDIDEPVIAAASKTPFESSRRVFVIERADELGDEAANRMLKTLEEPAAFVHIILLTDRPSEILPTIRSRCQAVRFEAPSEERAAAELQELGVTPATALACVRLALADADRARELAEAEGQALRRAAEGYARAAIARRMGREKPWVALLAAVRTRGDLAESELEALKQAELQLTAKKDKKRVETEWIERIRRTRRRTQTGALDLALQLVALWFADLTFIGLGGPELVRNCDREAEIAEDADHAIPPHRLRRAVELVEDTRQRFQLNVSEDLACEALAYRLEQALGA